MTNVTAKQNTYAPTVATTSSQQQVKRQAAALTELANSFSELLQGADKSHTQAHAEMIRTGAFTSDGHEILDRAARDDQTPRTDDDGRERRREAPSEAPGVDVRSDRHDDAPRETSAPQDRGDDGRPRAEVGDDRPDDGIDAAEHVAPERGETADRGDDRPDGEIGKTDGGETAAAGSGEPDGGQQGNGDDAAEAPANQAETQALLATAQGIPAAQPGGPAHRVDGKASQTGKDTAADGIATAASNVAKPTGVANAAVHGTPSSNANTHAAASTGSGDTGNAQQAQAQAQAGKPAIEVPQTGNAEARARQGKQISEAIGRAGDGSKVEVKVTTEIRGVRGPVPAGPQATETGGNVAGNGQTGTNTNTHAPTGQGQAQQQVAQQAIQQQQMQQQVRQTAQGSPTTGASAIATSSAGTGGAAAAHGLAGGGEATGPTGPASGSPQLQQSQHGQAAQQTHAAQPQRAAQGGQAVADQVSVKITKAVQAGQDRIHIQLKPAELGRVDVRIEMTHDGRAVTIVTADKADTLDLMRRDAEQLQKALADAGLETGSGDLSFNLRGEGQEGEETEDTGAGSQLADGDDAPGDEAQSGDDGVMLALDSGILMPGHVDLRA